MKMIKNKVTASLSSKIIDYNPVRDVCHFVDGSYLIISPKLDEVLKDGNVTLGRKVMYSIYFAIHLLVMIKYVILAIFGDPYTIAMLGESFHSLMNIYYISRLLLSIQIIMVPTKLTVLYLGDQYLAKVFLTISQFDTSLAFNRMNNRKLKLKIWLMSKLITKLMKPARYVIIPVVMLYCLTMTFFDTLVHYNLVTLVIGMIVNSIIQYIWLYNLVGITLTGGIAFYFILSMAKLRFEELIHLVRVYKINSLFRVYQSYNQLVIDIKLCRSLLDTIISIIYITVPFLIGLLCQVIIDGQWFTKIIAAIVLLVTCASNYIEYYMTSSICLMNKIIVKLLHPIQFDKRPKTRLMRLKIDSLIARLNKEFVGFYCLYAIKFNRMSFYKYILGISTTYFLVNGLDSSR